MRYIVIGITDHPHPWFPPEVMDVIRRGKVFSGGRRHHDIVRPLLPDAAEWIDITVPLDRVFEQYAHYSPPATGGVGGGSLVIFASGDPLFFGFANTIRQREPEADIVVYPAFNSLQTLCHRLLMPYHDLRIVSLTGRPWSAFDRALIERTPKLGILTDREHTPAAIARRMLDYGYTYYRIYVGEHLGHPDKERVSRLTLTEAAQRDFEHPNCVVLTGQGEPRPFGLADASFALLDGRKRMLTKMPIRLLSLQVLDLPRRHVLWDIGFCTGSISIEARLQFPHVQVEAFEIRPECEAIIRENARRHGTPGIGIHMGDFLTTDCDTLAAPDAVFIGGHGGHLIDIMAKAVRYLDTDGCIVMNSVTPQSRELFDEACRTLGLRQAPPMHIALDDYNPITILKCNKK